MGEKRNSSKNKKIVFLGTPQIATYALNALIDKGYEIAAVVAQPDKPTGRKNKIIYSPIKELAIKNNFLLFQPNKISDIYNELLELNPYAFITCAFGQFISDDILRIPPFGCINIHPSILPKYRGGAPIHWAIINQDEVTGISLMQTVKQMDAGGVYCTLKTQIKPYTTTSMLFTILNDLVYKIVYENIDSVLNNQMILKQQNPDFVTYAYNIKSEQEKITFFQPVKKVIGWILGLSDVPGAYCYLDEIKIKLFNPILTNRKSIANPGFVVNVSKEGIEVCCSDYNILIKEVQIENKKRLPIKTLINGNFMIKKGCVLN